VLKAQIKGIGGIRMTREEAIYYLKASGMSDEQIKSVIDAFTCDDCISREEAIRVAEQGQIQGYEWEFKKLCNLPSITPQPKIGKWITTRTFMHDGEFYCDKCKCDSPNNEKWDYCPNCGAKMEVEE
jgi:Zn finger protein HypA/HybF involved in hydrogenase expression